MLHTSDTHEMYREFKGRVEMCNKREEKKATTKSNQICDYCYEDDLPDMTDDEYSKWFENSYVDGVRIGPKVNSRGKVFE